MILFKNSNERSYYYKVNIYKTLFGDFLIQKEYGSTTASRPTNVIKHYMDSKKEALLLALDIVIDKKNMGYLRVA